MNAIVRFVSLALVAGLLAGCGSYQRVHVPIDRPYNQLADQYSFQRYASCASGYTGGTTGGGRIVVAPAAIPFHVYDANAGARTASTQGGATVGPDCNAIRHPSIAEPRLAYWQNLERTYCQVGSPGAGALEWGGCQRIVSEVNFWELQVSPSRFQDEAICRYEERDGKQTRICQEAVRGPWRKK